MSLHPIPQSDPARRARNAVLLLTLAAAACSDPAQPHDHEDAAIQASLHDDAATPAPLVDVIVAGSAVQLWPFTGTNVSGNPAGDPINLIFAGAPDARSVRAALMSLSGTRGGPFAPFTCRWEDAAGRNQTAFTIASGWTGSAIQLECGAYEATRFHVRLFPAGSITLANAHYEVMIPGTTDHEVLSWEIAEQLVTYDLARSGLLAARPAPVGPINPAPTYRTVRPQVYAMLPPSLQALIGVPGNPLGIRTDGRATALTLSATAVEAPRVEREVITLQFGQLIPKPFCSGGPLDWVYVSGPIRLQQQVVSSESGNVISNFTALGHLDVTPVNPITREVVGES